MLDVTSLPQPGDVLAGKYLVERVIGSGTASLVFAARHRVTGKLFAVEWLGSRASQRRHEAVIEHEDGDDASADLAAHGGSAGPGRHVIDAGGVRDAADLLSDGDDAPDSSHEVIGHFRHPNVLEVYDIGEDSGSLYTVMEWNEGESLQARIERCGPMTVKDAARLLVPCMRGMHAAHGEGILHRGLKPSNIFIFGGDQATPEVAKILAFEAAAEKPASDAGSIVLRRGLSNSKPNYCAPEQLDGRELDHRVDVYAFGAILYEVLTGRAPFVPVRRPSREDLGPTRLAALEARRRLPAGTERILGRAMAREVGTRFQSLEELADAIEALSRPGRRGIVTGETQHTSHAKRVVRVDGARPSQARFEPLANEAETPSPMPHSHQAKQPSLRLDIDVDRSRTAADEPRPAMRAGDSTQPRTLQIASGIAILALLAAVLVYQNTRDTAVVVSFRAATSPAEAAPADLAPRAQPVSPPPSAATAPVPLPVPAKPASTPVTNAAAVATQQPLPVTQAGIDLQALRAATAQLQAENERFARPANIPAPARSARPPAARWRVPAAPRATSAPSYVPEPRPLPAVRSPSVEPKPARAEEKLPMQLM